MALVTMKRLFDHAMKEKYTVGAYNVFNLDTLVAVLQAAEKEDSPVIVQLSMGSRKYQPYFETVSYTHLLERRTVGRAADEAASGKQPSANCCCQRYFKPFGWPKPPCRI